MLEFFFNRTCLLDLVTYPKDPSGGTVPTPVTLAVLVPCCVQQNGPPSPAGQSQYRKGTKAEVVVFFSAELADSPASALLAIQALILESRVVLDDGRVVILEGPPFDRSGQGLVYETGCKYTT